MKSVNKLHIALIQSDLEWENPVKNRTQFESKIATISANTHLIVLPEMFTTGFTMHANKFAETMKGDTVLWMRKIALQRQCAITGSIIITENNQFYNRLVFVHPSGAIETYDKHHTFTLAGEDKIFSKGSKKQMIHYLGWKICPLICYDLRFPVWSRNTEYYDVLLYVASWPMVRIDAWDTLLKARAIENMSYTIGVNRVGVDANGYAYNGNSVCYDSLGKCLEKKHHSEEVILHLELDKDQQDKIRKKYQFLEDQDRFTLNALLP